MSGLPFDTHAVTGPGDENRSGWGRRYRTAEEARAGHEGIVRLLEEEMNRPRTEEVSTGGEEP